MSAVNIPMLRFVTLLTLASCALSAHALDAYSSLDPAPDSYRYYSAYIVGNNDGQQTAFQFVATGTGVLSGFQLAMNDYLSVGQVGYTLRLYSDSGSDTLGSVLGTYSGMSTGSPLFSTGSALSIVAATGSAVTIQSGTAYWLSVESASSLAFNFANSGTQRYYYSGDVQSGLYGGSLRSAAFSVQVGAISSAVPGPAAALPFALMALRRRKRA